MTTIFDPLNASVGEATISPHTVVPSVLIPQEKAPGVTAQAHSQGAVSTNTRSYFESAKAQEAVFASLQAQVSEPITTKRRRGRPLKHDKPLRTRMGFRISDEMLQEVALVCNHLGIRKTDLILQAMEQFLQKHREQVYS